MPDSARRAPLDPKIDLTRGNARSPGAPGARSRGALHRRRRIRWAVASAAVALLMISRVAAAGPRIAVSAGSCPNRDAMIFALAQVLPSASIVPPTEALLETGEPMAVVTVSDDGASYQIQVGNIARTFFDPPARCEERAGKAAIVVALALEPPQFVFLQQAPGPPPAAPGESPVAGAPAAPPLLAGQVAFAAPAAPRPSAYHLWFEAGGAVEYARPFNPDRNPYFREVTARVAVERGDVGLVLGTAWPGWLLRNDGSGMSAERVPIELLLRLRHALGPIGIAFEGGPALVLSRNVDYFARSVETETDLRAAVRLELRSAGGYGAFVSAMTAYAFDPAYIGGDTPKGWIGASAGLMMQVR
jgi:hypothetical protein